MSVLIKGMAMPETCYECRFYETDSHYPFLSYCVAHINRIEDPRSGRLDTCPLEEAPIIDPKKFIEDYCRPRNLMVVSAECFRLFTEPKPVVIPTERSEE